MPRLYAYIIYANEKGYIYTRLVVKRLFVCPEFKISSQ